MAVLVEAISAIIRRESINAKYPNGWDGFVFDVPNNTLCADEDIARVGFITPKDVKSFVRRLEEYGFKFIEDNKSVDIAVVDQQRGFTVKCDWLEFGHVNLSDTSKKCAACRIIGRKSTQLITPDGWEYEGSLSQTFGYVSSEHIDRSLKFLRHENDMDVYLNLLNGEAVYIGRTS